MRPRTLLLSLGAMLVCAAPAFAQAMDASTLRTAGAAGEQANGYMGAPTGQTPSDAQQRAMDQINIQRREHYTQKAAETGVTVAEFAQFTACEIFRTSVRPGQYYRDENSAWHKATGPVPLPPWCPK